MKKHLIAMILALAVLTLRADVMLYWTVSLDDTAPDGGTSLSSAVNSFYSAHYGSDSTQYPKELYATLEGVYAGESGFQVLDTIVVGKELDTNITGYKGSPYECYILRLYNANEMVAYSDFYTYQSLIAESSTWQTGSLGMKADTAQILNHSMNFHAAPEPTSGLLMLLGLAGLALKRKRA